MPVSFDNAVAGSIDGNSAILALSLTVSPNPNRFLLCGVVMPGGATGTVSALSFGGQNLTKIGTLQSGATGIDRYLELWQLVNPPAGAQNGTVTASGTGFPVVGGFTSYIGVNQITPTASIGSSAGSASSIAGTVTSAIGDLFVDFLGARGAAPTPGGGQTQAFEGSAPAPGTNVLGASSYKAGATLGTMSWTLPAANTYAYFSLDLQAAPTPIGWKTLLGAGK